MSTISQATVQTGAAGPRAPRRKLLQSVSRSIYAAVVYLLLVFFGIVSAIPLVWMISTSLKESGREFMFPPQWIPAPAVWSNYLDVWSSIEFFPRYTVNSVFVAILATLGTVLTSSLVAFGFARMSFPGRSLMFGILVSTLMMPGIITLVPTYILFKWLRLLDSPLPLIVPHWFGGAAFGGAFYVFLLRQFFLQLPRELDEAAVMDGASYPAIYWRVIMPLSKPALAASAIFSFIQHWNDFMHPLIFINEDSWRTLALGLRFFLNTYTNCCARGATPWNMLMTASFLMLIPVLILFFSAQKYMVRGIALTGLGGR